jgi:O-antigen/teichoic acid export membrane protein
MTGFSLKLDERFIILMDQGLVSVASFLTGLILARRMGAEMFGNYSWIILIQMLGIAVQHAFIIQPAIYQFASKSVNKKEYTGSLTGMMLAFQLLLIPLIIAYLSWHGEMVFSSSWYLILGTVTICILGCFQDFLRKMFFLKGKPVHSLFIDSLNWISQVVLLLFISSKASFSVIVTVLLITYVLPCLVGLYWLGLKQVSLESIGSGIKQNQKTGGWLAAGAILQFFGGNYFLFQAGIILGPITLAGLRMSQYLLGGCSMLIQSFEHYVPRKSAQALELSEKHLRDYLNKLRFSILGVATLILVPVFLFAGPLLIFLGGDSFVQFTSVLRWSVVLQAIVFSAYTFRVEMRVREKNRDLFAISVITALFGWLCASWFIRQWQADGAVIGMIAAQLIGLTYWIWSLKRKQHENHTLYPR